jgi:hypothetical protein
MNRSRLTGLVAATILVCPLLASAADPVPDMKGKWVGKTESIIAGQGGHWPTSRGTYAKPLLAEKDVILEIKGQERRRFWGVIVLSGSGERTTEPFVGMLSGKDSRTVIIADTDGYYHGQLTDDDTYSHCYAHTGPKPAFTVVSCYEMKRAR